MQHAKEVILKQILSEDLEKFKKRQREYQSLLKLGHDTKSAVVITKTNIEQLIERIKILEEFLYGMHKPLPKDLHA